MPSHRLWVKSIAPAALLLGLAPLAPAAIYFGEDINTTATGSQENALRIAHPKADAARNALLANLLNYPLATETFEEFTGYSLVSELNFGSQTASLSPEQRIIELTAGTSAGIYPISGSKTLTPSAGSATMFTLTFDDPQIAFGFYVTDIEVPNNLKVQFHLADGSTVDEYTLPTLANSNGANNTGSVAYFGRYDPLHPFSSVSFIRSLNINDGMGFDNLTIAAPLVTTPEPATLALLCLGALPLLGRRRTR